MNDAGGSDDVGYDTMMCVQTMIDGAVGDDDCYAVDGDENMLNQSLEDAGIENNCMATGLCNAVLEKFNDRKYGFFSSPWQTGCSFFSILPFLTFLILNKPHDCYRCVGKDPERKYSKFQYSIID